MTTAQPTDWIQKIDSELLKLEEKPQFGLPAPYSHQQIEEELKARFERSDLSLSIEPKGWVAKEGLLNGIGEHPQWLAIDWTPLEQPAYFVTSQQDIKRMMAELLGGDKTASVFYDPPLAEGFYHYFAAEVLSALESTGFANPLAPRLGHGSDTVASAVGKESCFVIDLLMEIASHPFRGRLLLPESFRSQWKRYFAHHAPPPLSTEMRQKLSVDLAIELGHTRLSLADWKGVHQGDLILLDHCSYDPEKKKGAVILTLNQIPVFRGRLKPSGVKLTSYPIYEEVSDAMEEESFGPEDEDDLDLYGDLEGEEPPPEEEETLSGEEEPFDEIDEEEGELPSVAEPPPEGGGIAAEELPIHLTVEAGRVRMTAQELMDLSPGNLLELNVSVEEGVDLIVNGKRIGRGELVQMGDTLGVRILSL